MARYWPIGSLVVFMDPDGVEIHKNAKKGGGKYPVILTEQAWTYLLLTKFEVRTVSYGPSFFPFNLWRKREARGP